MKRVTDRNSPLFDRDDWSRCCSGKNAYENEWQARFAISESPGKAELTYYRCPYCGKFHLTSH